MRLSIRSRRLHRPTALGIAALALAGIAAPNAVAREAVSVTSGPSGQLFPVAYSVASANGRFVAMSLAHPQPDEPWPIDDVVRPKTTDTSFHSDSNYAIRDRLTGTTLALTLGAPGAFKAGVRAISDDGDRVMVTSGDPAFLRALGAPDSLYRAAVYERSTGRVLRLPVTADDADTGLQLLNTAMSADGREALVTGRQPDGSYGVFRGAIGGTAAPVLDRPDSKLMGASSDLDTFAYLRSFDRADPPADGLEHAAEWANRDVLGLKTAGQLPHRVAETTYSETGSSSTGRCQDSVVTGIGTSLPANFDTELSGHRLLFFRDVDTYAGGSVSGTNTAVLRRPDGTNVPTSYWPSKVLGQSHDLSVTAPAVQFVDGDRVLLTFGVNNPSQYDYQDRAHLYADPQDLTGVPADAPISFQGDEPVDGDTPPTVNWFACAAAPVSPVGTLVQYAKLATPATVRAGKTLGAVVVQTHPSGGVRAAARVTVEVRIAGLSVWRRALTVDGVIALPKAAWLLPTQIKVIVQPAAAEGQSAPPPLVSTRTAVAYF